MPLWEQVKTRTQSALRSTLNATPVFSLDIIIPNNSQMGMKVEYESFKADLSFLADEIAAASFSCDAAGAVTKNGSTTWIRRLKDTGGIDIDFNVATANKIRIQVTGIAATTVYHKTTAIKNIVRF